MFTGVAPSLWRRGKGCAGGGVRAGKSTVIQLMARPFLDATQGTVRIGGRDVRELDYEDLLDHLWCSKDLFDPGQRAGKTSA